MAFHDLVQEVTYSMCYLLYACMSLMAAFGIVFFCRHPQQRTLLILLVLILVYTMDQLWLFISLAIDGKYEA